MSKFLMSALSALLIAGSAIAAQCKATTQDGTRCKRDAQEGSEYCWQHQKDGAAVKKATKKTSEVKAADQDKTTVTTKKAVKAHKKGAKKAAKKTAE